MRRPSISPAQAVLEALVHHGLLLEQDKALPSVVGIITGESLRSSWWSHPKAHLVFGVLSDLADHPDVLITKLLHRKGTLIHRALWPALLAAATCREPWQIRGLSGPARALLERIDRSEGPVRASGTVVTELEARLLATAREIHTESGRHEKALESWQAWSLRTGCRPMHPVSRARAALERSATAIDAPLRALPWTPSRAAT